MMRALAATFTIFTTLAGGCAARIDNMNPMSHGQAHPDAPAQLSQFAFLIGRWRCDVRVKGEDGEFKRHSAIWTGRYILDGHVIADEYPELTLDKDLVRYGVTYRSFDRDRDTWVMMWLDATPPESRSWKSMRTGSLNELRNCSGNLQGLRLQVIDLAVRRLGSGASGQVRSDFRRTPVGFHADSHALIC